MAQCKLKHSGQINEGLTAVRSQAGALDEHTCVCLVRASCWVTRQQYLAQDETRQDKLAKRHSQWFSWLSQTEKKNDLIWWCCEVAWDDGNRCLVTSDASQAEIMSGARCCITIFQIKQNFNKLVGRVCNLHSQSHRLSTGLCTSYTLPCILLLYCFLIKQSGICL